MPVLIVSNKTDIPQTDRHTGSWSKINIEKVTFRQGVIFLTINVPFLGLQLK